MNAARSAALWSLFGAVALLPCLGGFGLMAADGDFSALAIVVFLLVVIADCLFYAVWGWLVGTFPALWKRHSDRMNRETQEAAAKFESENK